jgi:hypothetical protein
MLKKIEEVKSGQIFTCIGVEYKMLRIEPGTHKQPNRNQWGRTVGGHYDAISVHVKVNRRHKGWWYSRTAFRPGQLVNVKENA